MRRGARAVWTDRPCRHSGRGGIGDLLDALAPCRGLRDREQAGLGRVAGSRGLGARADLVQWGAEVAVLLAVDAGRPAGRRIPAEHHSASWWTCRVQEAGDDAGTTPRRSPT